MSDFAEWIQAILVLLVLTAAFAAVSIWNAAVSAWDWIKGKVKDNKR